MISGSGILVEATVIMRDKFSSGIIANIRFIIEKTSEKNKISLKDDLLGRFEEKYSCWLKMKRITALVMK